MEDPQLLDDELADGQVDPDPPIYAGAGPRFVALMLDFLVLAPLAYLNFYNITTFKNLMLAIIIITVSAAYKPVMEYWYGATVGKIAMGLKVVDYQYQHISAGQSLLRYLPWLIGNIVSLITTVAVFQMEGFESAGDFYAFGELAATTAYDKWSQFTAWIVIISALGILFNPYRQALHDQIAKTFCIYRKYSLR